MLFILIIILFFALMRLAVVAANLATKQWLGFNHIAGQHRVSVLIPARNEETNIGRLLHEVQQAELTPELEIAEVLVYDDLSTDSTAEVVQREAEQWSSIRLIRGESLPEGWLGKNHACHRLAAEATGNWLLFLDADVQVAPRFLADAIGFAEQHELHLLSLFPVQIMRSLGEWMVVPLMNWILVSLLPLILIRLNGRSSLSAANGQFMLFRADSYRKNLWHSQVKSHPVEDILICRVMKKHNLKVATLLSGGQVSCRMYSCFGAAMRGFSKNVGQFFSNSLIWMTTFLLLTTLLPVVMLFFLPAMTPVALALFLIYFCLALLIRVGVSRLSRQNMIINLILWPLQQIVLLILSVRWLRFRSGGKIEWKGRKV